MTYCVIHGRLIHDSPRQRQWRLHITRDPKWDLISGNTLQHSSVCICVWWAIRWSLSYTLLRVLLYNWLSPNQHTPQWDSEHRSSSVTTKQRWKDGKRERDYILSSLYREIFFWSEKWRNYFLKIAMIKAIHLIHSLSINSFRKITPQLIFLKLY